MSVNSVQNNTTNNKTSYFWASAIGTTAGYVAKYAIPLNLPERAEISSQLKQEKDYFKALKMNEIEIIRNENPKIKGADEFIKLYDEAKVNKKNLFAEITKLPKNIRPHIKNVISRINTTANIKYNLEKDKLKAFTKEIRPTATFVCIGAGLGFLSAMIQNTKSTSSNKNLLG